MSVHYLFLKLDGKTVKGQTDLSFIGNSVKVKQHFTGEPLNLNPDNVEIVAELKDGSEQSLVTFKPVKVAVTAAESDLEDIAVLVIEYTRGIAEIVV